MSYENIAWLCRSREVVSDTFITEYGDDNWHLMNTVGEGGQGAMKLEKKK